MRTKILAGNWKMNFGPAETKRFLEALSINPKSHAHMRLYVPYVSLTEALRTTQERAMTVEVGAQNLHFEKSGAFTGEISAPMLKEIGVRHVLVGHSERRQYFNETNETVVKRTLAALDQQIEPLVCIGETLQERESGQTQAVIQAQLSPILQNPTLAAALGKTIHLAYEPVWAIGTGKVATPAQAEDVHQHIRSLLRSQIGPDTANATRILYGGSVSPANFQELLACPNIDGGLVGGASLKLESWTQLWALI